MCHYPRTLFSRMRVQAVTKWRETSGAELVEFAFVIPLLVMLLLGIISFGRAWNAYETITRAAREGAREAVLTPCASCTAGPYYNQQDIWQKFIYPVLQSDNLLPQTVSTYPAPEILNPSMTYINLDVSPGTAPTGCSTTAAAPCVCGIMVKFTYPYVLSLPFTSLNLSTLNLTTQVQMRMENQPPPDSSGIVESCNGPVP